MGRFRILDVLGKGSQGIVYLAHDPDLERQVAIKTLRRRASVHTNLLQEARNVGRLQHPNIVPVYEIGEHAGAPYIVYEYVEGRSLREVLRTDGAIVIHQALEWMMQVLDGVHCAHEAGIVHRDLNPSNIGIGAEGCARVMDFGISMIAGTELTSVEKTWGTVNYLAPEQLSDGDIGPRTDLFSLGLILHEMLTGQVVFSPADATSAMYRIAHETVAPPSHTRKEVDPSLDAVVLKVLEKDPARRYASAQEMKQALEAFLHEGDESGDSGPGGQSTLSFVLRRMRRRSDLPAISEHISEISRSTSLPQRTSVGKVANTILKDYALTTKLLRLVNSPYYGQFGGRISTVSRAVVILGFEQVRTAAHSLLLFEHLNNKRQASQLKDAAGRALLSGVIGRKVAKETGFVEPEEAFVCSMLRSLGEYMTVFYLPDEQEEIARTVLNKGVSEDAACRSVLGLTYEELGVGIAREWRLPDNIVQSMRRLPPTLEKPRNPQEALQQLAAFSNELCKSVIQAEPEGQDTAVSDLMQRYTEVLPKKGAPVAALVSGALKDAQDFQRVSNVRLANTDSFRNATRWVESQGGARDGAASPETASAPAADSARRNDGAGYQPDDYRSVVMNGIQDISNALLENYALNDILVMVLETIFRGLGVTRVMFCIVNRKNAQVIARFGLGQDIDTLLRRFRFSLTEQRDPFARVVNEKQDVIYPELGIQLSQIPSWYRTLLAPTAFVMLPVVVNEVCIGVVYCDLEDGDRTFTGTDLNYLNTLRNQAALAIKQRS